MRKFLLLIAVALFSIGTYAQNALWSSSIQAVEATDAADYKSPAAFDNEGNLYVTGKQTVSFDFAEKEVESLGIGAYIAKYNVAGAELFAIALQGGVTVTAITTDDDNNLYVAGTFDEMVHITDVEGADGDYEVLGAEGEYGAFLAKYDSNGNLLAVKSYQAILPLEEYFDEMWQEWSTGINGMPYYGSDPVVSITKVVAEGSRVYAQFNYTGDVTVDANLSMVAKYISVFGMAYMDALNVAVVSFDSALENAVNVASLAVADSGIDVSAVHDFDFAVENESVYVAAFAAGNVVLSTAEGSEAFDFILDDSYNQEEGFIIANIGEDAVKFSNTPCEGEHPYYNTIAGMEVSDGCIYIAGTFNNVLALDNEIVAVGASDMFAASVDAATLEVNFVSSNANDEGATNVYFEEVAGIAFTPESILVYDQVMNMNDDTVASYKNYNVSLGTCAFEEAAEVQSATAVAYNSNYYALINCTDATNINVYAMPVAPGASGGVLETVVFDFVSNSWGIKTMEENNWSNIREAGEYTDGEKTINIVPKSADKNQDKGSYIYDNKGFLTISKPETKIVLPAFDFAVEKIEIVGSELGTVYATVDMNVYVGSTAVSTPCLGSNTTHVYEIAADKQAAGNVYELVIGSNAGASSSVMNIASIKVYPAASEGSLKVEAPVFSVEGGVYTESKTVSFYSPTIDIPGVKNIKYYYTTDGYEPDAECLSAKNGKITIDSSCTLKVALGFVYNGETYLSASTTANYIISEAVTYKKTATVNFGMYFIAAENMLALPFENGVLPAKETTVSGNNVTDAAYYEFSIEEALDISGNPTDLYAIRDRNGKYLTFSSMSTKPVITTVNTSHNAGWTIDVVDGVAKIKKDGYVLALANGSFVMIAEGDVNATTVLPSLYSFYGDYTAIENVEAETVVENAIYDLTGRRVNEITKAGIYIVNGKKVLVK